MKLDSNGNVVWEKKYGGTATDDARMIQQTSDGGFIFTGRTHSPEIDGYHNETYPILYSDVYVAKIDSLGNLEWQRALGGSAQDDAGAIQQTSDGGYMIIGATESNNGDITFNHGSNDIWLIKLSSTGNIEWEKTYGGSEYDWAYDFNKTSDGGFIISGTTISRDGDVSYRVDSYVEDVWILKLDSSGNIKWNKTYGGSNNDWTSKFGEGVQQTSDGGFIFIATSTSNDGDVSENHGGSDIWIVKLNPPGTDSSLPVTASVAINEIQSEGKRIKFEDAKITFNNSGSVTVDKIELKAEIVDTNVKGEGLVLQVGPNAGQIMHIPIDSVKPVDLGLIDGIPDVTTSTAASSSLAYVDEAMQKVSTGRSRLGSKYNALEHIISNLNNSSENLTAAESRIRDADIAEEMMNLTKNNILSGAAQAIMSQANQVPQRVLDLIQK